jgi:hypothetical protein
VSTIDKFFIWTERFSDTTLMVACVVAIVVGWSLFTAVAAAVLL